MQIDRSQGMYCSKKLFVALVWLSIGAYKWLLPDHIDGIEFSELYSNLKTYEGKNIVIKAQLVLHPDDAFAVDVWTEQSKPLYPNLLLSRDYKWLVAKLFNIKGEFVFIGMLKRENVSILQQGGQPHTIKIVKILNAPLMFRVLYFSLHHLIPSLLLLLLAKILNKFSKKIKV